MTFIYDPYFHLFSIWLLLLMVPSLIDSSIYLRMDDLTVLWQMLVSQHQLLSIYFREIKITIRTKNNLIFETKSPKIFKISKYVSPIDEIK